MSEAHGTNKTELAAAHGRAWDIVRAPGSAQSAGRTIVLGVSGASGAVYALRLLRLLVAGGARTHLVVSDYGKRLLFDETGLKRVSADHLLTELLRDEARERAGTLVCHPCNDVGAVIASGSFLHDGMVVAPCSSASLGAMASGAGSNLLTRAALVTLKENRPLIVCHREMPLSLIDIESMRTLKLAGATICSPNPGLYLHPKGVGDLVDFTLGKVLDLLGVEHDLATRWGG